MKQSKLLIAKLLIVVLAVASGGICVTKHVSAIVADAVEQKYTLLEPLPCIGQGCTDNIKEVDLSSYIGYIFKFSIALAALLAVIMIIIGGFEYVTSDIPGMKSNAKERITNAILGLVLIFASYLILYTIDPRLVQVKTSLERIAPLASTAYNPAADASLATATTERRHQIEQLEAEYAAATAAAIDLRNRASSDDSMDPEEIFRLQKEAEAKDEEARNIKRESVKLYIDTVNEINDKAVRDYLNENAGKDITDAQIDGLRGVRSRLAASYDSSILELKNAGALDDATQMNEEKAYEVSSLQQKINAMDAVKNFNPSDSISVSQAQQIYLMNAFGNQIPADITDPSLKEQYIMDRRQTAALMLERNPNIMPSDSAALNKLINDYKARQPAQQ